VRKVRKNWIVIGAIICTAAIAAVAGAAAAGVMRPSAAPGGSAVVDGPPGPVAVPAFPAFVSLPADQAEHASLQNEWWYVTGRVEAGHRTFGYEVQIIPRSNVLGAGQPEIPPETIVSITDVTTGKYFSKTFGYAPGQASFSPTTLDARTPNATLSGPLNAMHLRASMPAGTINLTLDAEGPAIYNDGNGLMPFLGGTSRYYSLPDVATTGTISENGHSYPVRGTSWLDHQWGNWKWANLQKWTWMGIHLSDGASLDLWDIFSSGREKTYATVLDADGKEQIVPVTPLAAGTSGFVTSPVTGQRYGSQWRVNIPDLGTSLSVHASPGLQEIQALGGINEAASTVTGRFEGVRVTGHAQVEQLGNWRS
jgi:predicted secreted hydrolase